MDAEADFREYLERLLQFVERRRGVIGRHGFVLLSLEEPRRRKPNTTQPLPTAVLEACELRPRTRTRP